MWQSSSTVGAFSGPREASVLFGLWCDARCSRRGVRLPNRQFRTVREAARRGLRGGCWVTGSPTAMVAPQDRQVVQLKVDKLGRRWDLS